jgi:hypothetical protein
LGASSTDDWRPALLEQFRGGGLVMEARRLNDPIITRDERVIRVVEFGIVYTLPGSEAPRRIFGRHDGATHGAKRVLGNDY